MIGGGAAPVQVARAGGRGWSTKGCVLCWGLSRLAMASQAARRAKPERAFAPTGHIPPLRPVRSRAKRARPFRARFGWERPPNLIYLDSKLFPGVSIM